MKEYRSKAVIMLVNAKTGDFEKMPDPVKEKLADPGLGNQIPRLTVFDKKSKNALGSLGYKQIGDKKAMRTLENAMRDYTKDGSVPGGEAEEDDDAEKPAKSEDSKEDATEEEDKAPSKVDKNGKISDTEMTEWTSVKGTKMKAKATRYKDGKLTLVRENGTSVQVTLAQLDADSRKVAEELIGE